MVMQLMNSNRWGVYAGSGNGTWDRMGAVDSRGISCCGNDTVGAKRIFSDKRIERMVESDGRQFIFRKREYKRRG